VAALPFAQAILSVFAQWREQIADNRAASRF
jgi:hypothetical protein